MSDTPTQPPSIAKETVESREAAFNALKMAVYSREGDDGSDPVNIRLRHLRTILAALEAAEARSRVLEAENAKLDTDLKYAGVGSFCDSETIAELMEDGACTWLPIAQARPERNGSLIVMTGDVVPIIGQAFWHEHPAGEWRLYWPAIAPSVDCWNDPLDETNHGALAFKPMPEAPCEERMKALRAALSTPNAAPVPPLPATKEEVEDRFDAWINTLTEDVVEGEYGYEPGEFTVYPEHWRPMFNEGLTPSAAFKRACEARTAARTQEEA